jgi:hypothetical protein
LRRNTHKVSAISHTRFPQKFRFCWRPNFFRLSTGLESAAAAAAAAPGGLCPVTSFPRRRPSCCDFLWDPQRLPEQWIKAMKAQSQWFPNPSLHPFCFQKAASLSQHAPGPIPCCPLSRLPVPHTPRQLSEAASPPPRRGPILYRPCPHLSQLPPSEPSQPQSQRPLQGVRVQLSSCPTEQSPPIDPTARPRLSVPAPHGAQEIRSGKCHAIWLDDLGNSKCDFARYKSQGRRDRL